MMKSRAIVSLSLALLWGACGDDHKNNTTAEPTSDASTPPVTGTHDASTPIVGETPDAGSAPIALEAWVNDLVDHHTADDATPDTVDDKNIADDENPTAYDTRFQ